MRISLTDGALEDFILQSAIELLGSMSDADIQIMCVEEPEEELEVGFEEEPEYNVEEPSHQAYEHGTY